MRAIRVGSRACDPVNPRVPRDTNKKTQPAENADWVALALAGFIERPQAVVQIGAVSLLKLAFVGMKVNGAGSFGVVIARPPALDAANSSLEAVQFISVRTIGVLSALIAICGRASMNLAEAIYQHSLRLPEQSAREVLDFIEFLEHRGDAKRLQDSAARIAPREPGSARGKLEIIADDDAHLKDFGDYMP